MIRRYVSVYLNILEVARGQRHVYVLDLLCGEGIYADGHEGTAVQIARSVKEHHFAKKSSNSLTVVLNDRGRSRIERFRTKIERVEEAVAPIVAPLPDHIEFVFSADDADVVADRWMEESESRAGHSSRVKRLFIIDPTGYTQFDVPRVARLLQTEGTEVFLFVPVPEMYRFVGSVEEGHPLRDLAKWAWEGNVPSFDSQEDFRLQLVQCMAERFGEDVYVVTVDLAKSAKDHYVLVYATRNDLGLEKVVNEKWKMDPTGGRGLVSGTGQTNMFSTASGVTDSFEDDLLSYVRAAPGGRLNKDVAIFTLRPTGCGRSTPTRSSGLRGRGGRLRP